MEHQFEPRLAEGSLVAEDVVRVPFDGATGEPRAGASTTWDLRVGKHVKLTGGPYEGDVGRVMEKSVCAKYTAPR